MTYTNYDTYIKAPTKSSSVCEYENNTIYIQ